jgi:hypothetical protein
VALLEPVFLSLGLDVGAAMRAVGRGVMAVVQWCRPNLIGKSLHIY